MMLNDMSGFNYKAKMKENDMWVVGCAFIEQAVTYCVKEDYDKNPDNTKYYIIVKQMSDWGMPNIYSKVEVDESTLCRCTSAIVDNQYIYENDVLYNSTDNIEAAVVFDEAKLQYALQPFNDKNAQLIPLYTWLDKSKTVKIIGNRTELNN